MPSNIVAITAAIAASTAEVEGLLAVYDYLPTALGDTPAHVFWLGSWQQIPRTLGQDAIEWTLPGYICITPISEQETERTLKQLLVKMIDAIDSNLSASGTIPDGTVQLRGGARGTLVLAGVPFQALRTEYIIVERYSKTYALGM